MGDERWPKQGDIKGRSGRTMADGGSERADGRIVKMEVDYSATVDQRLPECEKLAKVRGGRLSVGGRQGLSHGAEPT